MHLVKRKIFISGPMSGLPDFNYPAFHAAAARLRGLGYEVHSPAENPAPPCGTWEGYMRLSFAQLLKCEAVVLLPGWSDSRGALEERSMAQTLGMEFFHLSDDGDMLHPMDVRCREILRVTATDWSAA